MLNVFELNKKRDTREVLKIRTYRQVLNYCHKRMRKVSDEGSTSTFYSIPSYIPGLPKINNIECATYLVQKLRQNGLIVNFTYPNLLYISWDHIPTSLVNPGVKELELEMLTNPQQDFSYLVNTLNNKSRHLDGEYLINTGKERTMMLEDTSSNYSSNSNPRSIMDYRPPSSFQRKLGDY
jgi:Family of unknown function (DUF5759)